MKKIIFDCDGVLFKFQDAIYHILNYVEPDAPWQVGYYYFGFKDFKTARDMEHTKELSDDKIRQLIKTRKKTIELLVNTDRFSKLEYYPGVIRVFKELKKHYRMYIASTCDVKRRQERLKNLEPLEMDEKYVHMFKDKDRNTKVHFAKLIKPDIFVEDQPKNIVALANMGITVYYPLWHKYAQQTAFRFSEKIIGFKSWEDLGLKLLKQ